MEKKDKEEEQAGYLNDDPKKKMYDRLGSLGNPAYHTFSSLDHHSSTQPVLLPCPFFPYVGLVIEVSMSDYLNCSL